jgi:hypothetical protein
VDSAAIKSFITDNNSHKSEIKLFCPVRVGYASHS